MSLGELKREAAKCLAKAFAGDPVPAHVVQAAVSVLLDPTTDSGDAA